jgi:hypothetical protein
MLCAQRSTARQSPPNMQGRGAGRARRQTPQPPAVPGQQGPGPPVAGPATGQDDTQEFLLEFEDDSDDDGNQSESRDQSEPLAAQTGEGASLEQEMLALRRKILAMERQQNMGSGVMAAKATLQVSLASKAAALAQQQQGSGTSQQSKQASLQKSQGQQQSVRVAVGARAGTSAAAAVAMAQTTSTSTGVVKASVAVVGQAVQGASSGTSSQKQATVNKQTAQQFISQLANVATGPGIKAPAAAQQGPANTGPSTSTKSAAVAVPGRQGFEHEPCLVPTPLTSGK